MTVLQARGLGLGALLLTSRSSSQEEQCASWEWGAFSRAVWNCENTWFCEVAWQQLKTFKSRIWQVPAQDGSFQLLVH